MVIIIYFCLTHKSLYLLNQTCSQKLQFLLTLFRKGFFGAAHTYPTMVKLGTVIPYLRKIQKMYESRDTSLEFCWHQHFFSKFCYIKKCTHRLEFDGWFLILLAFLESLVIVLINIVTILMMSTTLITPGLLKIRVFWNKVHDVITFVHDVSN